MLVTLSRDLTRTEHVKNFNNHFCAQNERVIQIVNPEQNCQITNLCQNL